MKTEISTRYVPKLMRIYLVCYLFEKHKHRLCASDSSKKITRHSCKHGSPFWEPGVMRGIPSPLLSLLPFRLAADACLQAYMHVCTLILASHLLCKRKAKRMEAADISNLCLRSGLQTSGMVILPFTIEHFLRLVQSD